MSKYNWIIDAGHGGVDMLGHYTTDPKIGKFYAHPNFTIYEGVTNRAIARHLYSKLTEQDISFALCYDDIADWGLIKRANIVNNIIKKSAKPCILLSIHSNAGHGTGFEVFTTVGQDKSDVVAGYFCSNLTSKGFRFRKGVKTNGQMDKEKNFYIIKNVTCPAVLVELLFFDTLPEAEVLMSHAGQVKLAEYLLESIKQIELKQPI